MTEKKKTKKTDAEKLAAYQAMTAKAITRLEKSLDKVGRLLTSKRSKLSESDLEVATAYIHTLIEEYRDRFIETEDAEARTFAF